MINVFIPAAFLLTTSAVVSALTAYKYVKGKTKNTNKRLENIPLNDPSPLPGKTREQLKQEAQEKLGMDTKNYVNFGICGGSGSGKIGSIEKKNTQ